MASQPSTRIQLFDPQADALDSQLEELLVGGTTGPSGTSYLLRAVGIITAFSVPNANVVLAQESQEELRQNHVEGDSGIAALVSDMQRHGACRVLASEIRFSNGSVLRWTGLSRDSEIRAVLDRRLDVLLLDDVDGIAEVLYARLRDHALRSVGPVRRVVAACTRVGNAGWVDRHWNGAFIPGRGFLPMEPTDLDEDMIQVVEKQTYREFIDSIKGGDWLWPPHIEHAVDVVNRWVEGEWDHLAIFMPSQHAKTTVGPRMGIPFVMNQHPTDWCAVVSYGSDLANSRSFDARENYLRSGGRLLSGRRKINEWSNQHGGGCWSAGSKAGQAGKSATWAFIDDPDKDWFDAINKTSRKKKQRLYGSVIRARESMFAAEQREQKVCLTTTRWDPADFSGHALKVGHEAGESWAILSMSALYEQRILDEYRELYPNFHVVPDFRSEEGEPIWRERRSRKKWEMVRKIRGTRIFETECQQNAKGVQSGGKFWASWFRPLRRDPAFVAAIPNERVYVERCRAWDLAGTEGGGDWTVGAKLGRTVEGEIVIRHVVRAQLSTGGVKQLIAAVMILDGPEVTVRIPIDPAVGGIAFAEEITKYLKKVATKIGMVCPDIVAVRPRKAAHAKMSAKAARARDFQSFAQPSGWDHKAESAPSPGAVSFVRDTWSPAVSDRVGRLSFTSPSAQEERYVMEFGGASKYRNMRGHQDEREGSVVEMQQQEDGIWAKLLSAWPELATIAERGQLVSGDWWTPWLKEFQSFTGEDGEEDDQIDATVDAFDQVRYHEGSTSAVIRRN